MLRALLVVILIGGATVGIFYASMEGSTYKHVDEILEAPEKWTNKELAVQGVVQPGTVVEKIVGQKLLRTFLLGYNGKEILVRHEGAKPDTFQELGKVVAKGRLVKTGTGYEVHAKELIAKCPSKYEE